MDGGLGNSVHVDQEWLFVSVARIPRLEALHLKGLTAEYHITKSKILYSHIFFSLDQLPKSRRSLVQNRHTFVMKQFIECLGRTTNHIWHDYDPATVKECSPDFPHGEIKSIGVEHAPDVMFIELVPIPGRLEETHDVEVCDQTSLGFAGRSRGVNHVRKIVWGRCCQRIRAAFIRDFRPVSIQTHDLCAVLRKPLYQRLLS